jgi:hypothetical protein
MAIPLEMPMRGASMQYFEPRTVDYLAPETGGYLGSIAAGADLWSAEWQIGRIGARSSDVWRAWAARVAVHRRRFLGRDLSRPYPLKYVESGFYRMTQADGSGPFTGAAAGWSQAIDEDDEPQLTLTGLPAGLILQTGDYVGFRWDSDDADAGANDRRALVRVLEGMWFADASGAVTLPIVPAVPVLTVPAEAVAHLDNPACVMAFVPGDRRLGPIDRRLAITGGTITAVQDLRP